MAAAKNQETANTKLMDLNFAKEMEANYRSGVDISLYELANLAEADGMDWRQLLLSCGYSAEQIAEEVDAIEPPSIAEEVDAIEPPS